MSKLLTVDPYAGVRTLIKTRPHQQFALAAEKNLSMTSGTALAAGLRPSGSALSKAGERSNQLNQTKFDKGK